MNDFIEILELTKRLLLATDEEFCEIEEFVTRLSLRESGGDSKEPRSVEEKGEGEGS